MLELPGTSVSNVSFTTNGLTVTTGGPGGGTYAFTNVSYLGTPLSGFTATHDSATGLEAITFTSRGEFSDQVAASSGPSAGPTCGAIRTTGMPACRGTALRSPPTVQVSTTLPH